MQTIHKNLEVLLYKNIDDTVIKVQYKQTSEQPYHVFENNFPNEEYTVRLTRFDTEEEAMAMARERINWLTIGIKEPSLGQILQTREVFC